MKIEELSTKISELELRFEGLKDAMTIFQENINNNIYWFYSVLGIFVALLGAVGVALYFLVKTSVSAGIEKGIKNAHNKIEKQINDKREFLYASGNTSVSIEHGNLLQVYGFIDLSIYNFVSLTIINRHGRVVDYHSLDIKAKDDIRGFDVKIVDYNPSRDGGVLYYNVIWRNDTSYEDMIKRQKDEKILV